MIIIFIHEHSTRCHKLSGKEILNILYAGRLRAVLSATADLGKFLKDEESR